LQAILFGDGNLWLFSTIRLVYKNLDCHILFLFFSICSNGKMAGSLPKLFLKSALILGIEI